MTAPESALSIAREAEELAAPIPAYEPTGPLTMCPCCGGGARLDRAVYTCWDCLKYAPRNWSPRDEASGRAEWARIGVELRREGKLPPLKEAERWGVWADAVGGWTQHVRASEVPCSCDVQHPGSFHEMRGARAEAEAFATYARRYGRSYTVKPYPDAKQTSDGTRASARGYHTSHPETPGVAVDSGSRLEAPRSAPAGLGQAGGESSGGVDPYAAHRLAGERRRAELMAERPGVVARLTLAEVRLAEIDRELDRLDRTGEVE